MHTSTSSVPTTTPAFEPFFADLHVHVGRAQGRPIKIAAAANLTVRAILEEARERKGLDLVGIVDGASPLVLDDMNELLAGGEVEKVPGGGIGFQEGPVVLLAAEVELAGPGGRPFHMLGFVPGIEEARELSRALRPLATNINLSSQKMRTDPSAFVRLVDSLGGFCCLAHAFTPFKGVLGSAAGSLADVFDDDALGKVWGLELGLSSDTAMADRVGELARYSFLSNSDAHSAPKMAREYNRLALARPSFEEVRLAVERREGRRVLDNYGLDPRLGKYHRSLCAVCGRTLAGLEPPATSCPEDGPDHVIMGVLDRLTLLATSEEPVSPAHRPPYVHQVPLEFIPGLGPKAHARLLAAFGSEMRVLHEATRDKLSRVVGEKLATAIGRARSGNVVVKAGGGGIYGKVGFD